MTKWMTSAAAYVLLAGCSGAAPRPQSSAVAPPPSLDWRKVATNADRERLRGWRTAWVTALSQARAGGAGAQIAAEGRLFDPDRVLGDATPPPGTYRCRTFKLGGKGVGTSAFTAYPWFECRIADEGDIASFYKTSGSQRPVGMIFADTASRAMFLGTLVLGDEQTPMDYGRDTTRDMAGLVERIGPKRWRMVLPYPSFESTLDVIELVPAG